MPAENALGSIEHAQSAETVQTTAGAVMRRVGYRIELISAPARPAAIVQPGRTWTLEEMRRILNIR